jgi:hypothetical protein
VINSHDASTAAMARQVFGALGSITTDRAPIAIRKQSAVARSNTIIDVAI